MAIKRTPIIRRGLDAGPRGSGPFVKIPPDTRVELIVLKSLEDGLVAINNHTLWVKGGWSPSFPCIGDDCPGCELGNDATYKGFLPVYVPAEKRSLVFSFGTRVATQLFDLEKEVGEEGETLKGRVIRVRRSGSGRETSYSLVMIDKKFKVAKISLPDIDAAIGPTTRAEILKTIKKSGFSPKRSRDEDEAE